jgi:hypothetical protein
VTLADFGAQQLFPRRAQPIHLGRRNDVHPRRARQSHVGRIADFRLRSGEPARFDDRIRNGDTHGLCRHDVAGGSSFDQSFAFTYTSASQLASRATTNDAYAWSAAPANRAYARNGLNQYTSVSGTTFTHDARGNLTSDGSRSFAYDLENRLVSLSGAVSRTSWVRLAPRTSCFVVAAQRLRAPHGARLILPYTLLLLFAPSLSEMLCVMP